MNSIRQRQWSVQLLFWVMLLTLSLLAMLSGALFGLQAARSLWQQSYIQQSQHLDALVDQYRNDLLLGRSQDFLVQLQLLTISLATDSIQMIDGVTAQQHNVTKPFARPENNHDHCITRQQDSIMRVLWSHCVTREYVAYFDQQQHHPFLVLTWNADAVIIEQMYRYILQYVLTFFVLGGVIGTIVSYILRNKLVQPIAILSNKLHDGDLQALSNIAESVQRPVFLELSQLFRGVQVLSDKASRYYAEQAKAARQEAEICTARQVSHDIRSPLTALRVLVGHLEEVPEDRRVMIRNAVQRIEDIANDLRAKQEQGAEEEESTRTDDRSVQLLSSLIEPLISEKRTQHRAKLGVEIHAALNPESYGLFAAVQSTELKRVISNLINNAVEAMDRGLVTVAVRQEAEQVVITVIDTGKGIPPELLPKLMQQGATFGKTGGSGLGLYHARTTMESWGGTLTLSSRVGVGTTATLTLPRAPAPSWFVPELVLAPGSTIVIVDDDVSIHQIWQERLGAVDLPAHEIALQHFSSGTEVVAWFHGQANALFLCDYEFLGQPNNGLELIAQLGIHDRAILVTSHFDEAPIQQRCADLGVRLIPKGLAGFVPIRVIAEHPAAHVETASQQQNGSQDASTTPQHDAPANPTALVLDDDDGIRCVWPMEGRRLGLGSVATFASMEECEAAAPNYAQFDFAFVDKNIPDSAWRLDQVITHLKARGVKKVLVASGESAHTLASDPLCAHADGVIPMKIPQKLPT